ncbi:MAG TPA: hypothetical protein VNF73_01180 [Candidatus Saccharimonadales bacterium]|nr:hypothetical protein [Candidatus Saccharimonadales bacterium]
MEYARTHRSTMDPEMSTKNRGVILPAERGSRGYAVAGSGRASRNAFQEPADFEPGPQGCVGGGDPLNTNDMDGDFDAPPFGM